MLSYDDQDRVTALSGENLARTPRSAEEIEFWFTVRPKRNKWKVGETKEWRVRLAILGVVENREAFLRPFIDKKPSRVDFNVSPRGGGARHGEGLCPGERAKSGLLSGLAEPNVHDDRSAAWPH